jgi:acyl-CoA thioester hydrolase
MTTNHQIDTYRGVVYLAQCDAMGHMNVQHYVATSDQAMWHLVHELGHRTPADPGAGHGWADVRHVIDYRRELRASELYKVTSGVRKVGGSSLVTFHRMLELPTGELAAECEMT